MAERIRRFTGILPSPLCSIVLPPFPYHVTILYHDSTVLSIDIIYKDSMVLLANLYNTIALLEVIYFDTVSSVAFGGGRALAAG